MGFDGFCGARVSGGKGEEKKERGDSKEKENSFHCSFPPPPPHPYSDTDTQNYFIYFTLILRLPSLWTLPLGTKLQNRVWTMKEAFRKGRGKKIGRATPRASENGEGEPSLFPRAPFVLFT